MTRISNFLTISAATVALIGMAACNNRDDTTTGRTVDQGASSTSPPMRDAAKNTGAAVVTDAAITTKINAALVGDDQLKALNINVDTKDGKVVLTGAAPDAASLARATTMVKAVDGVIDVDNRLVVQPKG